MMRELSKNLLDNINAWHSEDVCLTREVEVPMIVEPPPNLEEVTYSKSN